jgi:cysteine-rich repeat protein
MGRCVRRPSLTVLAATFAFLQLVSWEPAAGHEEPPGCTVNGSVARITQFPSTVQHGQEICYRVEIDNRSGATGTNCNLSELDTHLVLPDGSTVLITVDAAVNEGELFGCPNPAESRCATPTNCTIPGRVGYRYFVNHADEHGATGTNCPPSPPAGNLEVSAFIESTGGTVHLDVDVGAELCKAIGATIPHGACCDPCTGVCNDQGTANECPASSTFTPGALCSQVTCAAPRCGDGIVTTTCPGIPPEACDDGNTINTDCCTNACLPPDCGDGFTLTATCPGIPPEACDDGNSVDTDCCTNVCALPDCGDGFTLTASCPGIPPEACDDANNIDTDCCTNVCALPDCGDGITLTATCPGIPPEACDDANLVNTDCCTNVCALPDCGDGFTLTATCPGIPPEACDDANLVNSDCCTNVCALPDCGDGFTLTATCPGIPPEACDDANLVNTDCCTNVCALPDCGDGFLLAATCPGIPPEDCDDGNSVECDGCNSTCLFVCGDCAINQTPPEACDGPARRLGVTCSDACDAQCTCCGDGVVQPGEGCDDANAIAGDGCNNCVPEGACCCPGLICTIEIGATCTGRSCIYQGDGTDCDPNPCSSVCVNNVVEPGETCDGTSPGTSGCAAVGSSPDACRPDGATNECTCCGDGVIQATSGETCDDGNDVNTDACRTNCTFCGDGIVNGGEACDDGNAVNTDCCTNACALPDCGDGIVTTTCPGSNEECDDANLVNTDCCTNVCLLPDCGDGFTLAATCPGIPPEACDDANLVNTDCCTNVCALPDCGDGFTLTATCPGIPPEACDDANAVNTDCCTNVCQPPDCGDGIVTSTCPGFNEACDDANAVNTDCCTNVCALPDCGDGIVTSTCPGFNEACDDANLVNTDCCTNVCALPDCGDGFVLTATCPGIPPETCDDANLVNTDCCTNVCQPPDCGDGIVTTTCPGFNEACDDANLVNTDCCTNVCALPDCGDGFTLTATCPGIPPEACDDANLVNTDCCTNVCALPDCGDGFTMVDTCPGIPAEECDDANTVNTDCCTNVCLLPECGDGIVTTTCPGSPEECDDANTVNTDCCTNACALPECGDGFLLTATCPGIPREDCDDGNATNCDGCNPGCLFVCGDCAINQTPPEACDGLARRPGVTCSDACDAQCTCCGDAIIQPGEECDDGNAIANDSCANCVRVGGCCCPGPSCSFIPASACTAPCEYQGDGVPCPPPPFVECIECGNNVTEPGETCDRTDTGTSGCTAVGSGRADACRPDGAPVDSCTCCGDGFIQATSGETCDDGNDVNTDACRTNCTFCGDGIVNGGEVCDDGNAVNTDCCTNACALPDCGDGIVTTTCPGSNEECDDANLVNTDCCTNVCLLPDCGDGFTLAATCPGIPPEACDDANLVNTDCCTNVCALPDCGDGFTLTATCPGIPPEACDDANTVNTDCCTNVCALPDCGDGFTLTATCPGIPPEACDDANAINTDCCTNVCALPDCGDGFTLIATCPGIPPEACDDANLVNTDCCTNVCALPDCGDGFTMTSVCPGIPPEACDDTNLINTDCCTNVCQPPDCGDGIVTTTCPGFNEACDDANAINTDCCTNVCALPDCGDGFTMTSVCPGIPPEACDDANTVNTDCCTNVCALPDCGDGFTLTATCPGIPPEACDDANTVNTDCCTNVCALPDCGDGFTLTATCPGIPPEACDDANALNTDCCTNVCALPDCGDGFTLTATCPGIPPEACDDANLINTDCCTNVCALPDCGDGFLLTAACPGIPAEVCDDANAVDTDCCTSACLPPACGDGFVSTCPGSVEPCDDGNAIGFDCCTNACLPPRCGDGIVTIACPGSNEQCDDGNSVDTDACHNNCTLPPPCPCATDSDCPRDIGDCIDFFCDLTDSTCRILTSDGPMGAVSSARPNRTDAVESAAVDAATSPAPVDENTAGQPTAKGNRVSVSQKGSLLYFPRVELKWACSGSPPVCTLKQDTFVTIVNDYPADVWVQWYFVQGDPPLDAVLVGSPPIIAERAHMGWNWVACRTKLTEEESTYRPMSGSQPMGCQPFTVLDSGLPPGRPDLDPDVPVGHRRLRGYAIAFAVDSQGREISWNHLSGQAEIVDYTIPSAWEYGAYAFQAVSAAHGAPSDGTPGQLLLNGVEYDEGFDRLLFDFFAVGSQAFTNGESIVTINTELTLMPITADVRQDRDRPVTTKAKVDIWNENEDFLSGTTRCINQWDQAFLCDYDPPNNFVINNLQTNKGKARIDGVESDVCEICEFIRVCGETFPFTCQWIEVCELESREASLLGVAVKHLYFSCAIVGRAAAGNTLVGQGSESGQVLFDVNSGPGPLLELTRDLRNPIGADAPAVPRAGQEAKPATRSPAGR